VFLVPADEDPFKFYHLLSRLFNKIIDSTVTITRARESEKRITRQGRMTSRANVKCLGKEIQSQWQEK